jgi:hypothetical protein
LENKGEMANINHVIDTNQVLRDFCLDIPVVKVHVG